MLSIIRAFRPWLDADPDLDICRSGKFGWVCIDKARTDNVEVFCQFPEDPQQLPQHLAEVARITLEVYAKTDDTAP